MKTAKRQFAGVSREAAATRPGPVVRLVCLLGLLAVLGLGCTTVASLNQKYDKAFAFGPMMVVAANPDDLVPGFAYADLACETIVSSASSKTAARTGATASAGGPPACPT